MIAITYFDLILIAGAESNPNLLTEGFGAVINKEGESVGSAPNGNNLLGIQIRLRPDVGFVKYAPCEIKTSEEVFNKILQTNSTCLVEIILERIVSKETFVLENLKDNTMLVLVILVNWNQAIMRLFSI